MNAADLNVEEEGFFDNFFERKVSEWRKAAVEWSQMVTALKAWEDRHLLIENPPPAEIEFHKQVVNRLLLMGQLLSFITSAPDFLEDGTDSMVNATQRVLRHKRRYFHERMDEAEADKLIKEHFPE